MLNTSSKAEILQTKHHFDTLDGLRGVAAISVVIFHFMEIIFPDPTQNFIGHGFMAVDFFFCLSGFVMAYAYDDRIEKMGLSTFFKARIIRLHPLVVFGSILGLLAFLFDPFGGSSDVYSTGRILLIFICSMLMIPFPVMEDRFFNLFGLNAPSWSLFWEYIANIVYALILVKLSRRLLLILYIIAGCWLAYVASSAGSLLGGWAGSNFWDGAARISYSFLAGILIFRYKLIVRNKLGFLGMTLLLILAFLMPANWGWLAELVVVLAYFPLIIILGAGAITGLAAKSICKFSADISYPLYMTHYAVMFMFLNYFTTYKPQGMLLTSIIVGGSLFLVLFAYLTMKCYDLPVRRYLTEKFRR